MKNKKNMAHNVEYFLKKFKAIPSEKIGKGSIRAHCGLWHVGVRERQGRYTATTGEAKAYIKIFGDMETAYGVNDGYSECKIKVKGETPKERIINALKKLNKKS